MRERECTQWGENGREKEEEEEEKGNRKNPLHLLSRFEPKDPVFGAKRSNHSTLLC